MTNSNNEVDQNKLILAAGAATALVIGAAAAYSFRQRSLRTALSSITTRDLEGTTACITGGNSGIGKAVALNLGRRGAKILMGCRNVESAKIDVCETLGHDNCHVFFVDLADARSVETFSESIRNATTRSGLQLLINNAGAMFIEQDKDAEDGWDRSMAVNHLGWVKLTQNLLPVLEKSAAANAESTTSSDDNASRPVRVINVGSTLEKSAKLPTSTTTTTEDPAVWDEWIKTSNTEPYSTFPAYSNSKLAMTATTFHWSKILQQKKTNIEMMVVSPGVVNTSLPRFLPFWKRFLSWPLRVGLLKTAEQGAESVLFAATSDAVTSGDYIRNLKPIQTTPSCSEAARNPEIGKQIWEATLRTINTRK